MPATSASKLWSSDVIAVFKHQNQGSDHPGQTSPAKENKDKDNDKVAFTEKICNHNRQRQCRDDQHDIDDTHNQGVRQTTDITGDNPKNRAQEGNRDAGDQTHQKTDSRAIDQHREDILTGIDGRAQKVLPWRRQAFGAALRHVVRVIGCNQRCKDCHDNQECDQDQTNTAFGVFPYFFDKFGNGH